MSIVIKKRVSLDFLGEDYKDSYLTLKAISVDEYEKLQDSKDTVKQTVVQRFIDGKIKQDGEFVDITKDNIGELSGEVFMKAFAAITGQGIDANLEMA